MEFSQMKNWPIANLLFVALFCALATGCSRFGSSGGSLRYEEEQGPFAGQTVELTVSRRVLDQAVSRGTSFNSLRMVEVFRRAEESGTANSPQYRLFDIQKGSVYDLVGLKTGDMLLAANGLIVFEPQGFKAFVSTFLRAVQNGTTNEIFISRSGVPMRLKITTVE